MDPGIDVFKLLQGIQMSSQDWETAPSPSLQSGVWESAKPSSIGNLLEPQNRRSPPRPSESEPAF